MLSGVGRPHSRARAIVSFASETTAGSSARRLRRPSSSASARASPPSLVVILRGGPPLPSFTPPRAARETLVLAALEAGASTNLTAMVVVLGQPGEETTARRATVTSVRAVRSAPLLSRGALLSSLGEEMADERQRRGMMRKTARRSSRGSRGERPSRDDDAPPPPLPRDNDSHGEAPPAAAVAPAPEET